MIINIELLVDNQEIIEGLSTGKMTRYGSVIRWSPSTEKSGQIFKHLDFYLMLAFIPALS